MATKRIHMSLSVRGALMRSDRQLKGAFKHDDGRTMTPYEARMALMDELKKGHECIPIGECDNFDYSGGGCRGHDVEPGERSDA